MAEETKETKLNVTIKDMLEAAAHFGHRTDRWNPKMKRFIFEERNGLYIIDLAKTMEQLRAAVRAVRGIVAGKQSVLFVGTKKQAKEVLRDVADQCGEFFVTDRWLGGLLTNSPTIRKSIKKMETIEKHIAKGGEGYTKKELSQMTKLQVKLERNLGGIRGMRKLPGLVIVVDPNKEHIAVAEAKKLGIPVMALLDTNCDPDDIDFPIVCNDDALKSIKLVASELASAIIDEKGKVKAPKEEVTE